MYPTAKHHPQPAKSAGMVFVFMEFTPKSFAGDKLHKECCLDKQDDNSCTLTTNSLKDGRIPSHLLCLLDNQLLHLNTDSGLPARPSRKKIQISWKTWCKTLTSNCESKTKQSSFCIKQYFFVDLYETICPTFVLTG